MADGIGYNLLGAALEDLYRYQNLANFAHNLDHESSD